MYRYRVGFSARTLAAAVCLGTILFSCLEKKEDIALYLPNGDAGPDGGEDTDLDTSLDTENLQTTPTATLGAIIRDFQDTHVDFESDALGSDKGIVQDELGNDGKPVHRGGGYPWTTHGEAAFNEWYRDVPGVNEPTTITLDLSPIGEGFFEYDNQEFFPVDGELLGNQDRSHNYHFTTEIHAIFTYQGGELFKFNGDDDVFVFINGILAMDLGGVHAAMAGTIDLDTMTTEFGIEEGNIYTLDFFHAQRHTLKSTFRITTTISDLTPLN